jgi:hypothetical protein
VRRTAASRCRVIAPLSGCEASPSVATTIRSLARRSARTARAPPNPRISSSGCAATTTAEATESSLRARSPLSIGHSCQTRSGVPGR